MFHGENKYIKKRHPLNKKLCNYHCVKCCKGSIYRKSREWVTRGLNLLWGVNKANLKTEGQICGVEVEK